MEDKQIAQLNERVSQFLARESNVSQKINKIEERINKMNNQFTPINLENIIDIEQKSSFNNFIRSGIVGEYITKSLSSHNDEAGVLITPTLHHRIISELKEKSIMRQLASVESISTRALDVIIEDGNFACGWIGEVEARPTTNNPVLVKKTIQAHEIYAHPKATQSLIDDAEINIENWLVERLVDSFTKLENEAFINGDGDNKPFGLLLNDKVVDIETKKDINAGILLNLINQVGEGYLANSHFLMNRNTLSQIQSLTDETGRFIWQQSLSEPLKQTIFGIPVAICSNMPNVEDGKIAIAIGDFNSAYKIVDRMGISLLRDPYTDKPFVRFYAVKRVGGDVVNPQAIKFARFNN